MMIGHTTSVQFSWASTLRVQSAASSQMAFCPRLFQAPPQQLCDWTSDRHTTCSLERHHTSVGRGRKHDPASPEQDFHFPRKVSLQLQSPPWESSSRFSTNQSPHELGRTTFHLRKRTRVRQCETSWSVDPW